MNNKEKREYINCLALTYNQCNLDEINKRNEVLRNSPNILYKYRKFDKWTSPMIKDGYAFLSPVAKLDDPFDCITDFDINDFYNDKSDKIKQKLINYIIKCCVSSEMKAQITPKIKSSMKHGKLEYDEIERILIEEGCDINQAYEMADKIVNCQYLFDAHTEAGDLKQFAEVAYNPGDIIGVCSLSELRDNKVMWSLYSKEYEGYCIEYEVPYSKEARQTLYPVLYSRTISNNFVLRMFDTLIADVNRNIKSNSLFINDTIENIGAIYELFCIKDSDWEYQREWRIVGGAKDHFKHLKIKAIYLGFKVKKTNEVKMQRLAKKHNFTLYKMNKPNGKKKITYSQVILKK